jgi:flavin-dependent dehydrogenase
MPATIIANGKDGWIFATPAPDARYLVQLVMPGQAEPESEAAECAVRILAACGLPGGEHLRSVSSAILDATPSFNAPIAGPNRIRVGDAAATSDPLAGDGVGRALRSAILAVATCLRSAEGDGAIAFGHYATRIALAQVTHLRACADFYSTSRFAQTFSLQISAMRRHATEIEALTAHDKPCLRLDAWGVVPTLVRTT